MYESYFGLKERPFSITPDPRYLFLGKGHRDALAHLLFGIEQDGGFVLLSGEVGTGKTTLSRALLEQVPDDVDIALILNPRLTSVELVASICDELGVGYPDGCSSIKTLVDRLNHHLIEAHAGGRRTMVVLDEAQNLSVEVLEQIRLLTNLETSTHKLLRMVLIGQSEINELLMRRELRQLSQRITARNHLDGLSKAETAAYVRHRVSVAGSSRALFSPAALRRLFRLTGGTPRLLNVLCDRALLGAYAHDQHQVSRAIVDRAAKEVGGLRRSLPLPLWLGLAASTALLMVALWSWLPPGRLSSAIDDVGSLLGLTASSDPAPAPEGGETGPSPPAPVAADAPTAPPTAPETTLMDATREPTPDVAQPPPPAVVTVTDPTQPNGDQDSAQDNHQDSYQAAPSAAQAPDTAPPLPPTIEAWLISAPRSLRRDALLHDLLAVWNVSAPDTPSCDAARDAGLRCLSGDGDWQRLSSLGLPVVLQLNAGDGHPHYALLQHLDDERLSLRIGDQAYDYWLNELEGAWNGRFITLWRPPAEVRRSLFPGNRGADVAWMQRALNRIDELDQEVPDRAYFGKALQSRVRSFQLQHGLTADGIVGEKTLIHLSAALPAGDQPRLTPLPSTPDS